MFPSLDHTHLQDFPSHRQACKFLVAIIYSKLTITWAQCVKKCQIMKTPLVIKHFLSWTLAARNVIASNNKNRTGTFMRDG